MKLLEFLKKNEYSSFSYGHKYYSGKHLHEYLTKDPIYTTSVIYIKDRELWVAEDDEGVTYLKYWTGVKIEQAYKELECKKEDEGGIPF